MKRIKSMPVLLLAATFFTCAASAADFAYIEIQGGDSLTLAAGQKKGLSVVAYTSDGKVLSRDVPVAWRSGNPSVAAYSSALYDDHDFLIGEGIEAVSPGTTTITATTVEYAADGKPATDTLTVTVVDNMKNMTVGPAVWEQLAAFNSTLNRSDMALNFVDAAPALIDAAAFQRAFSSKWDVAPAQVTDLNSSALSFEARGNPPAGDWTTARPGVYAALSGVSRGRLLPLKYVWNYSWSELSRILGGTVKSNPGASKLFGALRLDFYGTGGSSGGSARYTVIGSGGVSAADAADVKNSTPPLIIRSSGTGVSVELTVYLANVQDSSGPQLVEGLLIVPDGSADTSIAGTMWMLEGVTGGGGGGGGGCGSGFGVPALLSLLIPFSITKLKRR